MAKIKTCLIYFTFILFTIGLETRSINNFYYENRVYNWNLEVKLEKRTAAVSKPFSNFVKIGHIYWNEFSSLSFWLALLVLIERFTLLYPKRSGYFIINNFFQNSLKLFEEIVFIVLKIKLLFDFLYYILKDMELYYWETTSANPDSYYIYLIYYSLLKYIALLMWYYMLFLFFRSFNIKTLVNPKNDLYRKTVHQESAN